LDADMQANRPDFPALSFPMHAGRSGARLSSEIWPLVSMLPKFSELYAEQLQFLESFSSFMILV
jgi:hypothetical protein